MNPSKLTPKQKEEFGLQIKNSRYVRDFCSECKTPIRIPSGQLLEDNFCHNCDGHIPKGKRRYICDLTHLKDYDNPDTDSGYFDYGNSDAKDKIINSEHFPDEI